MILTGHTRFARIRLTLESYQPQPGWRSWFYEFLLFGFKQGWACLFGGLMLALLKRVPKEGDRIIWAGWRFEVVDMDGNRIDKVLATPRPPEPTTDEDEALEEARGG